MLVVPFCLEVTWSGTYGPRSWANTQVLEWEADDPDRNSANLTTIAGLMQAAYQEILAAMCGGVLLTKTRVLDINSTLGISVEDDTQAAGARSNEGMPGNVAVLATKIDAHTRGQRPGRQFFVGPIESDTTNPASDSLNAGALTTWQTAASAFVAALSNSVGGSAVRPAVLHKGPSALEAFRQTDLQVNALLATQRRRLRK